MINFISFFVLIVSITVHELAHAFSADRLGDPTPRSYGRLTLNPIAHADLLGTILLPLLSLTTGIPTIGWAKPVPIDPYNFSHPRRDEFLVALAGPLANFSLALVFSLLLKIGLLPFPVAFIFIAINVSLGVFNLIPLPPLDGSKIFLNLLPLDQAQEWQESLEKYGYYILLAALFLPFGQSSNLLSAILSPVTKVIINLLT